MRLGAQGGVILAYHNVVETSSHRQDGVDELSVTRSQLRSHLHLLRLLRFKIVNVSVIGEMAAAGEDTSGLAAITFDDALAGVYRLGLDVLAEAGVLATVYVPTDRPGCEPAFWPGAEATMTSEQLRTSVAAGHSLGSHTATHRSLVSLSSDELVDELTNSRAALQQITPDPTTAFAYPSGHHNAAVRAAVATAGYRSAATFLNGRVTAGVDPLRLPRLTMGSHSTRLRFLYHLLRPARSWPDHQVDVVGEGPVG